MGQDLGVLLNGLCGHSPQSRRPSIVWTLSTPGGHCHEQGKPHLATALGYTACLQGYAVLFASAIDVIHTLAAAKSAGRLKAALTKYTKPALLILDELGYLPIDKVGADLLFQVISLRYEQGAMILTSNRAFKDWPAIFNHDSTLTSAVLDRLLPHADTIIIEGKSFRMKDQLESETALPLRSLDASLLTPASSSHTLQARIFVAPTPQRVSRMFTWPTALQFHATADNI